MTSGDKGYKLLGQLSLAAVTSSFASAFVTAET